MQMDITKLSNNFMLEQALCFNLYPSTKVLSFVFVRMKYILKLLYFKFLKINAILFIVCTQNKISGKCVHIDCFSQHVLQNYIFNGPLGAGFSRRGCLNQAAPPLLLFSYV